MLRARNPAVMREEACLGLLLRFAQRTQWWDFGPYNWFMVDTSHYTPVNQHSCLENGEFEDSKTLPPNPSPTVSGRICFFVGVWGSLVYLPRVCGQNH